MRLPRFSLGSLLLAVLMIASTTTLILHYPVWRPTRILPTVHSFTYSHEARKIATLDANGVVTLRDWDGASIRTIPEFPVPADKTAWINFLNKGRFLVITSDSSNFGSGNEKRFWDVKSNEWATHLPVFAETQFYFAGSEDNFIFGETFGESPKARLVETKTGNALFNISGPSQFRILEDGTGYIQAAGKLEKWNLLTREKLHSCPLTEQLLSVCPEKDVLTSVVKDTAILVRDLNTGELLFSIPIAAVPEDLSELEIPFSATTSFSRDGAEFTVAAVFPETGYGIQLWDLKSKKKRKELHGLRKWMEGGGKQQEFPYFEGPYVYCIRTASPALWSIWDSKSGAALGCWDYFSSFDNNIIDAEGNIFELPNPIPITRIDGYTEFCYANMDLILARKIPLADESKDGNLYILTRRRPEAWWGIAWLPEFWTTLLFAGLFVWNALKSRLKAGAT